MPEILQWSDIEDRYHQGSLLLGNGASIAVSSCFQYSSLFEKAGELGHLTDKVISVFNRFEVSDFELVLRRLWQAKLVNNALDIPHGPVEEAYEEVRQALIETVRDTHVSYEEARVYLEPIYQFMQRFDFVISLNYDLIVYWAAQYGNRTLNNWFKDCFRNSKFRSDWQVLLEPYGAAGATLYFYPHGNLVLRREGFSSEQKIQAGEDANLLDSILNRWVESNFVPAFICEGTETQKRESISSCNYFEKVFYEVLPSLEETLVIYGWGFGDQDDHILEQIAKSNVKKVAVSIYGNNQSLCGHVEEKLNSLDLAEFVFFDSQSEGCWNN
ncbi:DUF4917 family protein [Microbulbifer sp. ZKSA006]|uniref:DUF4917 family protein n=1 Tax=Microbulbifer sp. ZKSA006 TaxID=3243390 RepID=UPI00403A5585